MKRFLVAMMMIAVGLSGCAGEEIPEDEIIVEGHIAEDAQESVLESGKGAIEGLLVDDRFRPLQLTDEPETEFQFAGYILIQEMGLKVQTNENGEFTVLDLDPRSYTIRAKVDGHEGIPSKVSVTEGVFEEVNVLVRRVSSSSSTILTEEYTGFTPCAVPYVVLNCLDSSAESYRPGPQNLDYSGLGNDLRYVVVEGLVAQRGTYSLQCRGGPVYANIDIKDGHYGKGIFLNSAEKMYDDPQNANPWDNPENWECILFTGGGLPPEGPEDLQVQLGIKHRYIISLFLGEPGIDLDAYQLLTEDSS